MRLKTEYKLYDELNLTPLMDLAWTLVIIFIIMATSAVEGIMVDLPKASASPSLGKPKTKAVTIAADGRIYLDTSLVTIGELEMRLREYKAANPDLPVVVRGDASIQYYKIMEVLDVMKRLQISQLGLVTQRLVK